MADTPDEPADDGTPPQPEHEQPNEPAAPAEGAPSRQPLPHGFRIDPSLVRILRDAVNAVDPLMLERIRRGAAAVAAISLELMRRNVAAMSPPLDVDRVRAQMDVVLPKIDLAGLAAALDRAKEALPPNWDGLSEYESFGKIAKDDGIPVVWVPQAGVLADLVAAPNRDERVKVLLSRQNEIADDCRSVSRW